MHTQELDRQKAQMEEAKKVQEKISREKLARRTDLQKDTQERKGYPDQHASRAPMKGR